MKIKVIFVDGYKSWSVGGVHDVEVDASKFNEAVCIEAYNVALRLDDDLAADPTKGGSVVKKTSTVITMNHEEGGITFVLMS